ncbi:MAG TPA: hypothetical protein VF166_14475, partial [Gemmatimonadaceae bacterium]
MAERMPPQKNNKKDSGWGRYSKTISFWILIILIPIAFIQLSGARSDDSPEIDYTQYNEQLQD